MKKILLMAVMAIVTIQYTSAQKGIAEKSLLWKVSGMGLSKPSYLFGTFHFLTNAFVDTMPAVMAAYKSSDVIIGELVMDSSLQKPMAEAMVMKGDNLKNVMPDTLYTKVDEWLKREANIGLAMLNSFKPISVMTVLMVTTQQKYFPNKPGETQLDTYFQNMATSDGKQILGLETIQDQIKVLFEDFTINRQVVMLDAMFKDGGDFKKAITEMNDAYTTQNLAALYQLMYAADYSPDEIKALLDDRNSYWIQQLPGIMQQKSAFVAVGALHLTGKSGLIAELRKLGYTVTPVMMNKG